jgi:hypothetical protein
MAADTLAGFPVRFEWALDDLRDPDQAQHNRLLRDQLVADDAVRTARRLGMPVIEVDGSRSAEAVADLVAAHFGTYLS